MNVDVSDIIRANGASRMLEFEEMPANREPVAGCMFDEPLLFKGTLTNINGMIELDGRLKFRYRTSCYRCLKELDGQLDIRIKENFVTDSGYAAEIDAYAFEGKAIDPSKALEDNIILNLPMKQVCSADCKGLCRVCGKNLNEGGCDCREENINPHMIELDKFFKN